MEKIYITDEGEIIPLIKIPKDNLKDSEESTASLPSSTIPLPSSTIPLPSSPSEESQ